MTERLEATAKLYDDIAGELDRAAAHARTAARHFRNDDVPRGAAHALSVYGHVQGALDRLDGQAREHAVLSSPEP